MSVTVWSRRLTRLAFQPASTTALCYAAATRCLPNGCTWLLQELGSGKPRTSSTSAKVTEMGVCSWVCGASGAAASTCRYARRKRAKMRLRQPPAVTRFGP